MARPAFETWLRDTEGVGIKEGEFFVGTTNGFVSEMLENRLCPLIERAVEHITKISLKVRFIVVPPNIAECPLCEREKGY